MMKSILTLLLLISMGFVSPLKVMASPQADRAEPIEKITFVNNSDCKGDRDDDCR